MAFALLTILKAARESVIAVSPEGADCFTSKSKVNAFDFKTDVSVTDAW